MGVRRWFISGQRVISGQLRSEPLSTGGRKWIGVVERFGSCLGSRGFRGSSQVRRLVFCVEWIIEISE
jgi:hypothetical protein